MRISLVPVRDLVASREMSCQHCGYPISVTDIENKDAELAKIISLLRILRA
jgi:hypothetical protein